MTGPDPTEIRRLMGYESGRLEPPPGFPPLPVLPGDRYSNPGFYQLEQQYILRRSWLLAGHLDEVREPGAFRLWHLAGVPVVIVHTESGDIRAFYNICRHRGAPVVMDESGRRSRFTCRYHGWSYALDRRLVAIRDAADFAAFDFDCHGLDPIRCERFGRLIFVNFDSGAPSLLDWLGPIAGEWEPFQFDRCRLAARHSFELRCNWKIAMETNLEVYHVPACTRKPSIRCWTTGATSTRCTPTGTAG